MEVRRGKLIDCFAITPNFNFSWIKFSEGTVYYIQLAWLRLYITLVINMTQEEKAKAYDEALERAKEINNEQCAQPFNIMTRVFPELAESEDEKIRIGLIEACKQSLIVGGFHKDKVISWLEKQGEQNSVEWSKEDETFLKDAIDAIESYYPKGCGQEELVDWLESLKYRVQPKQEWSEEDEKTIQLLIKIIETNFDNGAMFKVSWITPEKYMPKDKVIERIKSLRPQNTWKPSEEQMNLLQAIVNEPNNAASESCQMVLKEVIRQLKVL